MLNAWPSFAGLATNCISASAILPGRGFACKCGASPRHEAAPLDFSSKVKEVTAAEAYGLTVQGGTSDFAQVVAACEASGPWCLIGGLAVNTFVEPVYTLDADLVVILSGLRELAEELGKEGFVIEQHEHSINARRPGSDLRIQFTTDARYQDFLKRSVEAVVLGIPVRVASLIDTAQGKLWAYSDPQRRFSKRKKDELDLIRLVEAWPELRALYPSQLLEQIDRG